MVDWNTLPARPCAPDFTQLLKVLELGCPDRPVLFEFFLNARLHERLTGRSIANPSDPFEVALHVAQAYERAGYDYAVIGIPGFHFPNAQPRKMATISINEGGMIRDRASFDRYPWPDPATADYAIVDRLVASMPDGMGLLVSGPCGVLENVIRLVGYEMLCMLLVDDPAFVEDIFEAVGSRLVAYYSKSLERSGIGAVIGNDDWGFKSQTMLAPDDMHRLVLPWHKRIVEVTHAAGRPAILHSCGCLDCVWDAVIEAVRYDGKHSYEDTILPVEQAYERDQGRIAVLGGIDVDFVCRSTPEEIYRRSRAMLEQTAERGGYALGTGNSVPEYVPDVNYFAMIRAALDLMISG